MFQLFFINKQTNKRRAPLFPERWKPIVQLSQRPHWWRHTREEGQARLWSPPSHVFHSRRSVGRLTVFAGTRRNKSRRRKRKECRRCRLQESQEDKLLHSAIGWAGGAGVGVGRGGGGVLCLGNGTSLLEVQMPQQRPMQRAASVGTRGRRGLPAVGPAAPQGDARPEDCETFILRRKSETKTSRDSQAVS